MQLAESLSASANVSRRRQAAIAHRRARQRSLVAFTEMRTAVDVALDGFVAALGGSPGQGVGRRQLNDARLLWSNCDNPIKGEGLMRLLAIVAAAGMLVLAPTASSAPPPAVDLEIAGPGTIIAGGIGVEIPLTYQCNPRFVPQLLTGDVQQGDTIGQGSFFGALRCDNKPHDIVWRATTSGARLFVPGEAFEFVFLSVSGREPSAQSQTDIESEIIQIA
jgi:hypothetical protein